MEKQHILLSYRILLGIAFQLLVLVWLVAVCQYSRFPTEHCGLLTAVALGASMSGAFLVMAGLRQVVCSIAICELRERPSL